MTAGAALGLPRKTEIDCLGVGVTAGAASTAASADRRTTLAAGSAYSETPRTRGPTITTSTTVNADRVSATTTRTTRSRRSRVLGVCPTAATATSGTCSPGTAIATGPTYSITSGGRGRPASTAVTAESVRPGAAIAAPAGYRV